MKRYLITGGTGFIGSAIVKRLAEEKNYVRVMDNSFRSNSQVLFHFPTVDYIVGDIRNIDDVKKASVNIDSIIHLAYINGTKYFYEKPDLVLEVGVKGILNVLDAARINGVKELCLASSSEVYQTPPLIPTPEKVPLIVPDPQNPRYSYGGGKIISELLSIHIGKKIFDRTIIFRPHNVYGPNMGREHVLPELILKTIKLLRKGENINLPIQGDGSNSRSFIYIDDFVDAFVLLLNKGENGQIYNIGTSEEIDVLTIVKYLEKIINSKIKIKHTPLPVGSVMRRCPDINKISKLGFISKVTFFEGLKKTFIWYNNSLNG